MLRSSQPEIVTGQLGGAPQLQGYPTQGIGRQQQVSGHTEHSAHAQGSYEEQTQQSQHQHNDHVHDLATRRRGEYAHAGASEAVAARRLLRVEPTASSLCNPEATPAVHGEYAVAPQQGVEQGRQQQQSYPAASKNEQMVPQQYQQEVYLAHNNHMLSTRRASAAVAFVGDAVDVTNGHRSATVAAIAAPPAMEYRDSSLPGRTEEPLVQIQGQHEPPPPPTTKDLAGRGRTGDVPTPGNAQGGELVKHGGQDGGKMLMAQHQEQRKQHEAVPPPALQAYCSVSPSQGLPPALGHAIAAAMQSLQSFPVAVDDNQIFGEQTGPHETPQHPDGEVLSPFSPGIQNPSRRDDKRERPAGPATNPQPPAADGGFVAPCVGRDNSEPGRHRKEHMGDSAPMDTLFARDTGREDEHGLHGENDGSEYAGTAQRLELQQYGKDAQQQQQQQHQHQRTASQIRAGGVEGGTVCMDNEKRDHCGNDGITDAGSNTYDNLFTGFQVVLGVDHNRQVESVRQSARQ